MTKDQKEKYDNSAINRNLTWTPVTVSNIENLCKDPVNQHFGIYMMTCTDDKFNLSRYDDYCGTVYFTYLGQCTITGVGCGTNIVATGYTITRPCNKNPTYKLSNICIGGNCTATTLKKTGTFYSKNISQQLGYGDNGEVSSYWCYCGGSCRVYHSNCSIETVPLNLFKSSGNLGGKYIVNKK